MNNVSCLQRVFSFSEFNPAKINSDPEMRSRLIGEMESLISRVEKESRELNEEEKRAWNFAFHLLKQTETDKYEFRSSASTGADHQTSRLEQGFVKPTWQQLHGLRKLDFGEFKGLEHFLRTAAGAERRSDAMVTNIGVFGGFNVPSGMASMIWSLALESSIALPRCTIFPMPNHDLTIPAWDSEDKTAGPIALFAASWLSESGTAQKARPKLRGICLEAQKLAVYCDASRELVQDGNDMQSQIGNVLKSSLGYAMDEVIINGNGVAKPRGVMNQPSRITVPRASVNDVQYTDLVNMIARMIPSLVQGAVWICSPPVLVKLLTMTDAGNHYVWQPGSFVGAAEKVPQTIFGLPLFISEKASNLGQSGDIMLINFSCYGIGIREQMILETSNAPNWTEDEISFRVIARLDGASLLDTPVTPAYGGSTLSWAITLS